MSMKNKNHNLVDAASDLFVGVNKMVDLGKGFLHEGIFGCDILKII